MEHILSLLRDEMRAGFEQLHTRLDEVTRRVDRNGEDLASLKPNFAQCQDNRAAIAMLQSTLAAHRARCPYDGDSTAVLAKPRSPWRTREVAAGIASGSAGMIILLEILKWIARQHGQ